MAFGHDVVRLSGAYLDGRPAQSADAALTRWELSQVEAFACGRSEALPPVAEVQLAYLGREHFRVFGVLVDGDAVAYLVWWSCPKQSGPQSVSPRTGHFHSRKTGTVGSRRRSLRYTVGSAARRYRKKRCTSCIRRRRGRGKCSRPRVAAPSRAVRSSQVSVRGS